MCKKKIDDAIKSVGLETVESLYILRCGLGCSYHTDSRTELLKETKLLRGGTVRAEVSQELKVEC